MAVTLTGLALAGAAAYANTATGRQNPQFRVLFRLLPRRRPATAVVVPGEVHREHAKVTSDTTAGRYTIGASIEDRSGGRSRARASVTYSP